MVGAEGTQIIVMKLAANDGDILWTKWIGGTAGENDVAWSVAVGPDDQPVVTGFVVNAGNDAVYLTRKLDNADGHQIWEDQAPGAVSNIDVRTGWLAVMDDGDLAMVNRTFGSNGYDVVLKRYAAQDGDIVWETVYDGETHGGDDPKAMVRDAAGNILVAGVQDVAWNYDYMVLKFDQIDGGLIWEARYDGPPGGWYDVASCIVEGHDGDILVAGLSDGIGTGWDYAIVAFDETSGQQQWAERYDGPASQSDEARDLAVSADGHLYVTGYGYGIDTNKDMITLHYELEDTSPVGDIPVAAGLTRTWPNPFNPRVNFAFDLPAAGAARLEIFDLRGLRVASLVDGHLSSGRHQASWDGRDLQGQPAATGVYLAILRSADIVDTRKIVLAK